MASLRIKRPVEAYCPECDKVHQLHWMTDPHAYRCHAGGAFALFISRGYSGYNGYSSMGNCPCDAFHLFSDRQCQECHLPIKFYNYEKYMPRFVRRMKYDALDGCHSQELADTIPEQSNIILFEVKHARSEALALHLPPVLSDIVLDYFGAVNIVPR